MTDCIGVDVHNDIAEFYGCYLDEYDAERFWVHVHVHGGRPYADDRLATAEGECWLWNGATTEANYGRFKVFGQWRAAHRIAFKDFGNKLPDELDIDHLCRIHNCVRPSHLEAVTTQVNMSRGIVAQRTHCKNGHEYTAQNTRLQHRGELTYRLCITCRRAYAREGYKRRSAA